MSRIALLLLAALALLCTGCLDYTEQVWLRADGSARIETVLAMKDHLAAFGGEGETPLGADREFEDGSGRVWTERKDGELLTHLEADIADFRSSNSLAPGDIQRGKVLPDWYSIEPLGFGRYRVLRSIGMPQEAQPAGDSGGPLGELGRNLGESLAQTMFEGYEFSVTLNAPVILASNADVQRWNQASWQRPLTEISKQPFTLEATVLLLDYRLVGAAAGAVLLLLAGLIVAARKRRRSAGGRSLPSSADEFPR